jgi:hypothetical protein
MLSEYTLNTFSENYIFAKEHFKNLFPQWKTFSKHCFPYENIFNKYLWKTFSKSYLFVKKYV